MYEYVTRLKFSLVMALLACHLLLAAQPEVYHFEKLPESLAAPNSTINCILQDKRGFLWLGTWSGLFRYNGYEIQQFRQASGRPGSLQSDQITCLLEDSRGQLWVGAINAGFYQYDAHKQQFINHRFDPQDENSLSNNDVWSLFEDSKGFIWIGTRNGLNRFDPRSGKFLRFPTDEPALEGRPISDYIYSICETADGSIWSATTRGITRIKFSGAHQHQRYRYELSQHYPAYNALDDFTYRVKPVHRRPHALWLATKAGLKQVQYDDQNMQHFQVLAHYRAETGNARSLSNNVVWDVLEDTTAQGGLWVATAQGLNRLDLNQPAGFQRFFSEAGNPHALSNNRIRSLYIDRSGILWIGADRGLDKLNLRRKPFGRHAFQPPSGASNSVITSVASGSANHLWLGASDGFYHWNTTSNQRRYFQLAPDINPDFANFISRIDAHEPNRLWLATQGAGLMLLNTADLPATGGKLRPARQLTQPLLNDNYVMDMHHSADASRCWLGLWDGGVDLYLPNENRVAHFQQLGEISLTNFPNVSLLETQENNRRILWIGTRGNGLLRAAYDPATETLQLERQYKYQTGKKGSLSSNKINHLYLDSQGRLWVATAEGLSLLLPGGHQFRHFQMSDGLPDDDIQSVTEDAAGQIWVSTQHGIAHLGWNAEGALRVSSYDKLDGLQDNFFNNNCVARMPDGRLVFGGVNGLTSFWPQAIHPDATPPQTAIVSLKLFNQEVPVGPDAHGRILLDKPIYMTPSLSLNHSDNVLSLEFVSLHFGEPQKNLFAYQLVGFDENWVYTHADKRYAHYTNLPYRDFTFRVKSANADGHWGETVTLNIRVNPPFWLSWWAYVLYFGLFMALLYGVWRITNMRAEFRNRLALEHLEREKLDEVNQLKLQFFTNISHELRTPLTLIISPLEQIMQAYKSDVSLYKSLDLVYQHAGKLLAMINQLLDFRKTEAGLFHLRAERTNLVVLLGNILAYFKTLEREYSLNIDFMPDNDEIEAWIDRDQFEKALFNLLSNALKYTPAGEQVSVRLSEDLATDRILLSISDRGPGIAPEELDQIFMPFFQGSIQPRLAIFGGTGIGLSLVRTIINNHHGSIQAENQAGGGARFIIRLRRGCAHLTPSERVETPVPLESEEPQPPLEAASLKEAKNWQERPHLLIVEDNSDILSYLFDQLRKEYDITTARNGEEALAKATEISPDLVLSDIAMPRMDGLELCRRLKSDVLTSHIPVVLLTARTSLIYKIDGLETGADDYITKPFNVQLLEARLRNLIRTREKLREKFSKTIDLNPSEVTANSLDEAFLRQVLACVEKHIDNSDFSVDDLARELALSRMQLYRKIKALSNETPNTLIRGIRLNRAAQLLATRQYHVSEVAYQVGFTDLKYFRERFKEKFGVIPSEFNRVGEMGDMDETGTDVQ